MKQLVVPIAFVAVLLQLSCNSCPDRQEFNDHIKNLENYYFMLRPDSPPRSVAESDQIHAAFNSSIAFLEKTTELKSHAVFGWATLYKSYDDFKSDSIQYMDWYAQHCE